MKDCLLLLPAFCLVAGCAALRDMPAQTQATVRLLGRWDASGAPERLIAVNPGSSLEFRYRGTSCTLHVDASNLRAPYPQLWVQFDGQWSKVSLDRGEIAIGEGAVEGTHRVWVILKSADEHQPRWKPPLVAALVVTGIEAPGGRFLRPPRKRRLVLEAIGDSITEGILAVRAGRRNEWTEIADSRATYAFRTAMALGAEPRIIGFGRQGITIGGNGGVPPVGLAYPFVYDRVPAAERPADIVVINQGSNDGRARSIEHGYLNLIRLVRSRNPGAEIFCLVPFTQVHAESVRRAVASARAAGDDHVHLVETAGWLDPKTDTTDGVHPNLKGHEKAAARLTEVIRQRLSIR